MGEDIFLCMFIALGQVRLVYIGHWVPPHCSDTSGTGPSWLASPLEAGHRKKLYITLTLNLFKNNYGGGCSVCDRYF